MPGSGTPSMDRMGLKFGSLSLFGEAAETGEAAQAPPLDAPSPPVPIIEEPLAKEAMYVFWFLANISKSVDTVLIMQLETR
jgi:hypothetical protein